MAQHFLNLINYAVIGGLYNTGDGIRMCQDAGAKLWHMAVYEGLIQPIGCGYYTEEGQNAAFAATLLRSGAFVVVGDKGKRFGNEYRATCHGHLPEPNGLWENPRYPEHVYAVWDQTHMDEIDETAALNEDYRDTISQCASVTEAAAVIGCDEADLQATIDDYAFFTEQGRDYEFGRDPESLRAFDGTAYYVMPMKSMVLNTQGGPQRNEHAQVLGLDDEPIPHLYSAGEIGAITANRNEGGGQPPTAYGLMTMLNVLGISRSTVRYYESLGIVSPERSSGESGRRVYSDNDLFRVVNCTIAKNSGLTLKEASDMLAEPTDRWPSFIQRWIDANERCLEWDRAVERSLARVLETMRECESPTVTLRYVEEWNFYPNDLSDSGYSSEPGEESDIQMAVYQSVPVTSYAAIHRDTIEDSVWGTSIVSRDAWLVPELASVEHDVVGGCPCAALLTSMPLLSVKDPAFRTELRHHLDEVFPGAIADLGCEPAGERFSVGTLPVGETYYLPIYQPVRATSMKGRRALARLGKG